jgi:hypothetical protein
MKRATRMALVGIGVVAVVAFFVSAPIIYSPTTVYGPILLKTYPTNPNWESLSCRAFGFGMYYGRTVFQPNDSYQFGCPSPTASVP